MAMLRRRRAALPFEGSRAKKPRARASPMSGAAASSVRHHDFPPDAETVSFSFASQFLRTYRRTKGPRDQVIRLQNLLGRQHPSWREWLKCVHARGTKNEAQVPFTEAVAGKLRAARARERTFSRRARARQQARPELLAGSSSGSSIPRRHRPATDLSALADHQVRQSPTQGGSAGMAPGRARCYRQPVQLSNDIDACSRCGVNPPLQTLCARSRR